LTALALQCDLPPLALQRRRRTLPRIVVQAPPSVLVPGVVSVAAGAYCGAWCAARPTATYGLRTVAAWSYCDGGSNDLPRRLVTRTLSNYVHRTAPHLIKFINKENCQASAAHSNQVSSLDADRRRLTKQLHEAAIQSTRTSAQIQYLLRVSRCVKLSHTGSLHNRCPVNFPCSITPITRRPQHTHADRRRPTKHLH